MTYTVKEFTQMFHVTEHTVRYYTDIGLLPCNRDGGNHRSRQSGVPAGG